MPVYNWSDPEEQRRAIQRERARNERVRVFQATTGPDAARAVSQMAAYYPTMSPGVALPLALGGVAPTDPIAQQVATREAKANKRKRGFWGTFGDIALTPLRLGADALGEVGELATDIAKPVVRHGFSALMAPYELGTGVFRNIAAAGGEIAAGAAAGAATGAGLGLFGGPLAPLTSAAGAIGGAVVGGIGGALAQQRGVDIEGEFRNPLMQTTLGQDLFGGKDTGQGYMPGGSAMTAQMAESRGAASIGGHALTPGRMLASSVADVDTAPYKLLSGAIDMANAWKLDPTNVAGIALGKRMTATRKFTREIDTATRAAAGAIDGGHTPGVLPEAAHAWLTSDARGMGFVELMRTTNSFEDLRRMLPGVAPETLLDIEAAQTTDEILGIMVPRGEGGAARGLMLERGLADRPAVASRWGQTKVKISNLEFSRRITSSRLFADLPGRELNVLDHGQAVEDFSNLQRTANFAPDVVAANNRQLAVLLRDGNYMGAIRHMTHQFVGSADGVLQKGNVAPELANKMERLLLATMDDLERKAFFEQGLGTRVSHADIAGESFDLTAPSVLSEDLGTVLKIERNDIRAMRRATSKLAPVFNHSVAGPIIQTSVAAMDFATAQVWKPAALLRGAYTVRVIAEEQIRMANSGVDSLFAHPLSYLAWMASDEGKMADVLKRLGVTVSRGDVDVLGKAFTEAPDSVEAILRGHGNEFAAAQGRKANREHWMDGHVRKTTDRVFRRGEEEHVPALTERIATLHQDPIARRVANGGLLDDDPEDFRTGMPAVHHWLDQGAGVPLRQQVGNLKGSPLDVGDTVEKYRKLVADAVGAPYMPQQTVGTIPSTVGRTSTAGRTGPVVAPGPRAPTPPKRPEPPPGVTPYRVPEAGGRPGKAPASKSPAQVKYEQDLADYERRVASYEKEMERHGQSEAALSGTPRMGGTPAPARPAYGAQHPVSPGPATPTAIDRRLQHAIATGEIDGVPIYLKNGSINPEFRTKVAEIVDEGHGPMSVNGSSYGDPSLGERWDSAVEKLFNAFMGNRTAKLSRSPHFRQYYWKEAERLAFTLNPEDQARLLANMDKAELPEAMKAAIRQSVARGSGDLNLEQVDMLLKGRALDATRELLYDVSKRGQLSDIMRIIWPFAEAQKEVMKTWARIGTQNPAVVNKARQTLQGGQGEGGVFYKDPQTGELMFTYPGSQILTEKIFGIPIPLGNRVEGLSMFGSGIMPGFGPVAQLSARWFLPDKPQYDQIREMVDPFGESAEGGVLEQFGPGWVKAILTGKAADPSDASFGNDMMDIYNAGLSSGMYGNSTPDEIRDGMESAKNKARWLTILRGASQMAGAPSPPRPEFLAMDPDGRWTMMDALVQEYRKMVDNPEIGLDGANEAFLNKFGVNVFALVQPSTYAGGKVLPESTTTAGDWARTHEELAEKFPNIYGLFAPKDPDAPFDIAVWARQKRTGERVPMEPEQRVRFNNDRLASAIYYNVKDRFGPFPNAGQRKYIATVHDALQREYPGFDENIGLPEKVDTEQRITELTRAIEDPDVADNPVTEPTRLYLALRDRVNQAVSAAGVAQGVAKAKGAAPGRAYLRQAAEALITRYPEFGEVWDRVFEPELVDDSMVPEEVPVGA